MIRDLSEISDGKVYDRNSLVRVVSNGCLGCHECCEGMGDSIVLDPMDLWRLTVTTGLQFDALLQRHIDLHVEDRLILPGLKMDEYTGRCTFLNEEGRCSIHPMRPGLCRLFPLGRIYEENAVRYFLQAGACPGRERSKIKIETWLEIPDQKGYDNFLLAWHELRGRFAEKLGRTADEQEQKALNLFFLNLFYVAPYDDGEDFFGQFQERCGRVKQML